MSVDANTGAKFSADLRWSFNFGFFRSDLLRQR
jgi:hypothetical protein